MNESASYSRSRELILRWCDNQLTDEETLELDSLILRDALTADLFAELTHVNAALENLGPALPQSAIRPHNFWTKPRHVMALAAALLIIGTPVILLRAPSNSGPARISAGLTIPERSVAVVNHMLAATWDDGERALRPGDLVGPSRIRLRSGLIQLQFFNGVQAVLQGPVDFEVISAEESFCHQGRFHAIVPPQANCFRVRTHQGELIDFGTEFGLDVTPDGAEVHVFDGEVAFQPQHDVMPTRLGEGRAALISPDGSAQPREIDANLFASYREVNQMQAMSTEKRLSEWYHSSRFWRTHPAGVAYFDFEEKDYLTGTIRGESANPYLEPVSGLLVGAELSHGRWPGKAGLSFARTSDRVRINIPGTHRALTLAAWVRTSRLQARQHGLLMSDGSREGAVHWSIDGTSGRVSLAATSGANDGEEETAYLSDPIFTEENAGQWVFLASAYDADHGVIEHYLDGKSIGSYSIPYGHALRIGVADIGNWTTPAAGDHHFEGIIDELMIFSLRLNSDQLTGIAQVGRPY